MPDQLYANIALDIEAKELRDKLFAYKIPEHLEDLVFVGSQVLVPFGNQHSVGGYVVSITDKKPIDINRIRSISEVVEAAPLFDDDYIDFLQWLAFTSCATLADVIAASLPSFLAPRLKRKVKLTDTARLKENFALEHKYKLLNLLLKTERNSNKKKTKSTQIAHSTLKRRYMKEFGKNQKYFYQELAYLRKHGLVEVTMDTENSVKAKVELSVTPGTKMPEQKRHKEIVDIVDNSPKKRLPVKELVEVAKTTRATIKKLSDSDFLKMEEIEIERNPLPSMTLDSASLKPKVVQLTEHQEASLSVLTRELEKCIDSKERNLVDNTPWLLHGVTGSGKTEVYLRLIEQTLAKGRSALLLVPEISLTPQLATQLVSRFRDKVAVWHSAISQGERLDTWKRLRSGQAKILLGARSAVLANIDNLGLIILDEEHDTSYKQTSPSPRYNAKAVAQEKARRTGSLLVFGSATPDLVSYSNAQKENRILELPERVHKQNLPEVDVVDMRRELANGNRTIFSNALQTAISERLEKKEQIILLINRRGYANHVFCRACGFVAKCKNCSVTLTFHRYASASSKGKPVLLAPESSDGSELSSAVATKANVLKGFLCCHHCGINKGFTTICPECKSPFLKEYGLGTQKVEESIHDTFEGAKTVRLDSDVTTKKGEFKRILDIFNRGEADILIGTQMVAKGLDVPNVTLVGVLAADASLNMPDYRSSERGFQLLAQVAGRAGRGIAPGKVVFQTYNPELEIFKWAKHHDYHNFYEKEISNREEFQYPPFSRIVRIVVSGSELELVEAECDGLAQELVNFSNQEQEDDVSLENFQILGPAPCIIERLRGSYRYHILLKIVDKEDLLEGLLGFLRMRKAKNNVRVLVDVDALDLL